jgi:hypothetical protein
MRPKMAPFENLYLYPVLLGVIILNKIVSSFYTSNWGHAMRAVLDK